MVDLTVNVTTPEAPERPEAAEIVSVAPRLEASVTVLPATAFPYASRSVTVTVDVVEPSATIEAGEAATSDCDADPGPATNATDAVWPRVTESVVSLAVSVAEPPWWTSR